MPSPNPLHDFFETARETAREKNKALRALYEKLEEMDKLPYREVHQLRETLIRQISECEFGNSAVSSQDERAELKNFFLRTIAPSLGSLGQSPRKLGIVFQECIVSGYDNYHDDSVGLIFGMAYSYPFRVSRNWFNAALVYYLGPFFVASGNRYVSEKEREAETILLATAERISFTFKAQRKLEIPDCKISFRVGIDFDGKASRAYEKESPGYICTFSASELKG